MEYPNFLVFMGTIFVWVFIHEILHLIFVPNLLTSNKTSIGITWFGGFIYTEELISRTRYIVIVLAPFFLLSILLPIILNILGLLNPLVILLMLFNAIGSSVDMLILITILVQVPAGAYITLNGMKTYWKK